MAGTWQNHCPQGLLVWPVNRRHELGWVYHHQKQNLKNGDISDWSPGDLCAPRNMKCQPIFHHSPKLYSWCLFSYIYTFPAVSLFHTFPTVSCWELRQKIGWLSRSIRNNVEVLLRWPHNPFQMSKILTKSSSLRVMYTFPHHKPLLSNWVSLC